MTPLEVVQLRQKNRRLGLQLLPLYSSEETFRPKQSREISSGLLLWVNSYKSYRTSDEATRLSFHPASFTTMQQHF